MAQSPINHLGHITKERFFCDQMDGECNGFSLASGTRRDYTADEGLPPSTEVKSHCLPSGRRICREARREGLEEQKRFTLDGDGWVKWREAVEAGPLCL